MLRELRTIPPFEDLDEEVLRLVEPLFERYTCPAGTVRRAARSWSFRMERLARPPEIGAGALVALVVSLLALKVIPKQKA